MYPEEEIIREIRDRALRLTDDHNPENVKLIMEWALLELLRRKTLEISEIHRDYANQIIDIAKIGE